MKNSTNWKKNTGTVVCGDCGKDSGVLKSGNDGTDAATIENIEGEWCSRLPVLIGIVEWLFACSKKCMKDQLDRICAERGITDEQRREASAKVEKMRAKIPAMVKETTDHMAKIMELIKSGYAGVMPGTGNIVDCRDYPDAVPIQKNEMLKVPESKANKK